MPGDGGTVGGSTYSYRVSRRYTGTGTYSVVAVGTRARVSRRVEWLIFNNGEKRLRRRRSGSTAQDSDRQLKVETSTMPTPSVGTNGDVTS